MVTQNPRVPLLEEVLADRLRVLAPSLVPLARQLALAAASDMTVLLTGESGTGKTYLACLMHAYSSRRDQPLLAVPCGAQDATLFESIMFGHERGEFAGDCHVRQGKIAAAGRGTILLDEIDTLGLKQQAALLRLIETGEYEAVGSSWTQNCEARFIFTSKRNLDEAVGRGDFGHDLFYRLQVISIDLPPLRERPDDIRPLARAFTAQFAARFRKPFSDIGPEVLRALTAYPWPGNIREMENVLREAVLDCSGTTLSLDDLPTSIREQAAARKSVDGNVWSGAVPRDRVPATVFDVTGMPTV